MDAPVPRHQTAIEVASLIVGPALMSIGDLFHPPESWDVAAQYSMIVATSASGRWHMAHLLLFIGMLLFVPGILAMTRIVANRRPAAGYAARILLLMSVGALSAVFVFEMVLGHFISAGADQAAAIALLGTFQSGAVFGALMPALLAFFVGVAIATVSLGSRPGPYRWPILTLAVGAAFILGEIVLAQVLLSQIGNILCLVAGIGFALPLLRGHGTVPAQSTTRRA